MNTATLAAAPSTRAKASVRAQFLRWLRRIHSWLGLWGAVLGLLFGSSGILLNHRATLKINAAQAQEQNLQLEAPTSAPANARALGAWLQQQLQLSSPASRVREEPAHPVEWSPAPAEGTATAQPPLLQPAHWSLNFGTPADLVQADWWVGNRYVSVRRSHNNLWGTLMNLHKGVGMGVAWILLVDTLAGSILLLSLSGVILWSQLNRKRLAGAGILTASLLLSLGLIAQGL